MNLSIQIKIKTLLFLFIWALLIPGCGVWENFTTYFNTYYNASDLFDKAEKQINKQEKDLFSTEPPNIPSTAKADLVKVIDKLSDILQFSSESAYVEDALLMLGKSFYYQKNYQKSSRKFTELQRSYPESNLLLEAQLWIGKNQMRLKKYNEALTTLAGVKNEAVDKGEDDIVREAYIEEIVYKITVEDYPAAITAANEFMEVSDDDAIKAQVWFEIGKLNILIGDVENAITAYENVFEYSPDFDLEFNAKLHYGIALREGNRNEDALEVFEDMRKENKYTIDFAEIDFEIAKTNRSMGDIENAVSLFAIVDTTYKGTKTSGASKFELGQIYEYEYLQLDSAANYYKKAASSSVPKEYILPAREKNNLFIRYFKISNKVSNFGKQLFYNENPDEFIKDSVLYVEDSLAIAEEISNIVELQAIWAELDSLISLQDTVGFFADTIRAIDTLIVRDTTLVRDTLLTKLRNPDPFDLRFVSSFDSVFKSEAFERIRKIRKNQSQQQRTQQQQLANKVPDSLRFKNNPPRWSTISNDSLRVLLAKNELELGNLFLTELEIPDSSRWYYYNILNNYPNTRYEANTLYALGSYYLTQDNKQRADSLFNVIYEDYRDESIVNAAADKLNKPLIDLNYDPAKPSFDNAESIMLNENYSDAIEKFYDIYKTYPESQYAPKALYASGWILENKLSLPDSAVFYYDTLVVYYPTTIYVKNVGLKLSAYKQEQRKLQLAKKDSLNTQYIVSEDSLTADSLKQFTDSYLQTSTSDTSQVALQDQEKDGKEKRPDEQTVSTLPKIKEPLWNPRKRR